MSTWVTEEQTVNMILKGAFNLILDSRSETD